MESVVSLRDVVDELDALTEESVAYLNRATGATYAILDEWEVLLEDDVPPDELPDWQQDELPRIREVVGSDDWLPLPTRFDIHEWAVMDEFARSLDDPDVRDELAGAIRGRGAFRCFQDTIRRRGVLEEWRRYRMAALERIAIDWLEGHSIAYTGGDGSE